MSTGERFIAAMVVAGMAGASAAQDRAEPLPKDLEGVGITENLDAPLPLETRFVDETGKDVALGEFFNGGKPVVLTLNYYRCPMLCTLILNGLVHGLKDVAWNPGTDFEVVTVSIDPRDTPEIAAAKKKNYVEEFGRPGAAAGWHFLTGTEPNIHRLADALGFRYRYVEETGEFAHGAAIFLVTPEGRVSRYLYGVEYDPSTLRFGLLEASKGRIGSALDRFVMYCYHYDATAGKYAPAALRIMQVGGALTVFALGIALSVLWLRDARRRRAA